MATSEAGADAATSAELPRAGPRSKRIRRGWIAELAGVGALYYLYDWLRDKTAGDAHVAFQHAKDIVAAQRFLGIYWERDLQHVFVHVDWFMAFWNIWYGTIHFVMPVIALVALYRKMPQRYVRWRNTLVIMWGLAVLTFWLYPLMPPRLMPAHYGFIDTAAHYYNFGPQVHVKFNAAGEPTGSAVKQFGNLFAAMPSFHVGWSTWSVIALWPLVRRRWLRALLVLYPITIIFCIVVTANHWLLDAVGGWIVLAAGYVGTLAIERFGGAWRMRRNIRARAAASAGAGGT
jgi:PAP2 superfamily